MSLLKKQRIKISNNSNEQLGRGYGNQIFQREFEDYSEMSREYRLAHVQEGISTEIVTKYGIHDPEFTAGKGSDELFNRIKK